MHTHEIRASWYPSHSPVWFTSKNGGGWMFDYIVDEAGAGHCSAPGRLSGKKAQEETRFHVGLMTGLPNDYYAGDLNITVVKVDPRRRLRPIVSYNIVRECHEWAVEDGDAGPLGGEMRRHLKKAKSARAKSTTGRSNRLSIIDARHYDRYSDTGYGIAPGSWARWQIAQRAA